MNYRRCYPEPRGAGFGRFCYRACWSLLLGGFFLGMTYLWAYSQVMRTSRSVQELEGRLGDLGGRSVILSSRLESLQAPSSIGRMLEEREIALGNPEPGQVVRVRERAGTSPEAPARPGASREMVILSISR